MSDFRFKYFDFYQQQQQQQLGNEKYLKNDKPNQNENPNRTKAKFILIITSIFIIISVVGVLMYFLFNKWLKHKENFQIKITDSDTNISSYHYHNGDDLQISFLEEDKANNSNLTWKIYYDNKKYVQIIGKNANPLLYTLPYNILSDTCFIEVMNDKTNKVLKSHLFSVSSYWRQTQGIGYLPQQTIVLGSGQNKKYEMDFKYDSKETFFQSSKINDYSVWLGIDDIFDEKKALSNIGMLTQISFKDNKLFFNFLADNSIKEETYYIYIKANTKHIYLRSRYSINIRYNFPTSPTSPTSPISPTDPPIDPSNPSNPSSPTSPTNPTPPTPPIPNAIGSTIVFQNPKDSSLVKHIIVGDTVNIVLWTKYHEFL